MKNLRNSKSRLILAGLLTMLLFGCEQDGSDPTQKDLDVGTVAMALISTQADGTQYQLPTGTVISFTNEQFYDHYSLNGEDETISVNLTEGVYQATLTNQYYPDENWALELITETDPQDVAARLITPIPVTVTVTAGTTTDLTFEFSTNSFDNVVFSTGTVDVSIDVENSTAAPGTIRLVGDCSITEHTMTTEFPEFAEQCDFSGTSGLLYNFDMAINGEWYTRNSQTACVNVTINHASGQNHPCFVHYIEELETGEGQFCLEGNSYYFSLYREGGLNTDLGPMLDEIQSYMPAFGVSGNLPFTGFDGTTVHLKNLEGQVDSTDALVDMRIWGPGYSSVMDSDGISHAAFIVRP